MTSGGHARLAAIFANPTFWALVLPLLAAHLLADFVFQTDRMVQQKRQIKVLLSHAAIVAGLAYLCVCRWTEWEIPCWVGGTHFAIDFIKVRLRRAGAAVFAVDQLLHIAVLTAIAAAWAEPLTVTNATPWVGPWSTLWIVLSGVVLCVRVGGVLIGFWVQPYLDELRILATARSELAPGRGLTNGGRVIGQWERALIFLFVGMGQPGAIGFLVAAKSIFRFGELKDRENRMEAEYITIGTLMSFGWATLTSYITWWLVK